MKISILIIGLMLSIVAQARDIKIVVPYTPGGATDRVCRLLQTELSNKDYNFVLEYRTGAGGATASKYGFSFLPFSM
jgi:tripartite-type tricarboxylate transporter receptor subunit TctC